MDLPQERKPEQSVFDREKFLAFLVSHIEKMGLPEAGFMRKAHPLLGVVAHTNNVMKGIEPGRINSRYEELKKSIDIDFFTHQITEIINIGKKDPNPANKYFYQFVYDTYLYSEGKKPLYQAVLKDKLIFLWSLKRQIEEYRMSNQAGVSQGVDKLKSLVDLLSLEYVGKLDSGKWTDEDRLFIYKLFQECKAVYQAKQDQAFTYTRNKDAIAIYAFIGDALPRIGKEQIKTETVEEMLNSFVDIGNALNDASPKAQPAKPELPPRRTSNDASPKEQPAIPKAPPRSTSNDASPKEQPAIPKPPPRSSSYSSTEKSLPIPPRRKSSTNFDEVKPGNPENDGSVTPRS